MPPLPKSDYRCGNDIVVPVPVLMPVLENMVVYENVPVPVLVTNVVLVGITFPLRNCAKYLTPSGPGSEGGFDGKKRRIPAGATTDKGSRPSKI